MKNTLVTLAICAVAASLSGCARLHEQPYTQHAQMISPVVIPEGIRVKPAEPFYPIPPVHAQGSLHPSLYPPGGNVALDVKELKEKKHRVA